MARRLEYLLCALALAGIAGLFCISEQFVSLVYCEMVVPFLPVAANQSKLFECSNVEQTLDLSENDNLLVSEADAPGWRKLTPRDPAREARVKMLVLKDRSTLVFFPRVSGSDSSVTVIMPNGGWPIPLFRLQGEPEVWTPVGRQYLLRNARLDNSLGEGYRVPVEIVLKGPWAQLWLRDGKVFF